MDTLIQNDQTAPQFSLPDLDGVEHHLREQRGQIVIVHFWSAECPWAERADQELLAYLQEWGRQVLLWSIAANTNEAPELLQRVASARGLPLVLHDQHQQVADLYGAQTTPHFFVIDHQGLLRYQGAFDDVTFRQRTPTQAYLRLAVGALLSGRSPDPAQTQPYGCTIMRYAAG